jgi:hypothetical protein
MTRLRLLAGCWMLALGCAAAPPTTLVQDTIFSANGIPFNGTATIEWPSFTASDSTQIAANSVTVRVVSGLVSVRLVPTTTASPGAYYTVRFNANGKVQFTQYWNVPSNVQTARISQIKMVDGVAAGVVVAPPALGPLGIGDVTGLSEALASRVLRGASFQTGRAAIVDLNGEIGAASGSPSDCLRVDGTSGPCVLPAALSGFVDLETPLGTVDGANVSFTLSVAPSPAASLHLYRNGILQRRTIDFTVSGTTLTFLSVSTPQAGDIIQASYRTAPAGN